MKFQQFLLFATFGSLILPAVAKAEQEFNISIGFADSYRANLRISSDASHRLELSRMATENRCFGNFSAVVGNNRSTIRNRLLANGENATAVAAQLESRLMQEYPRVKFTEQQREWIIQMARAELQSVSSISFLFLGESRGDPKGFQAVAGGLPRGSALQEEQVPCEPSLESLVQLALASVGNSLQQRRGFGGGTGTISDFVRSMEDQLGRVDRARFLRLFEDNEAPLLAPAR